MESGVTTSDRGQKPDVLLRQRQAGPPRFGQDISAAHGQEFFQKIGVLFEFPYLYANLSAVDNLNYFASFYHKEQRRDIGELLDALEFKPDFLKKPVSS